jgi:cytochrome c553
MADLNDKLAELHEAVTETILGRFRSGDDISNDDMRVAMQLLKNNNISAVATNDSPLRHLAAKLDFSAMAEKVVPLRKATVSEAPQSQPEGA